jgi:hypothetical protein
LSATSRTSLLPKSVHYPNFRDSGQSSPLADLQGIARRPRMKRLKQQAASIKRNQ